MQVARWPEAWRIPAWFHVLFKTIKTMPQLRPAMERYIELIRGLGCVVELQQVEVLPEDLEIWRMMQPPVHFLKDPKEYATVPELTTPTK